MRRSLDNIRIQFLIAWRNLWRNKRRTFITVASVFFAVLLALVADSMNYGTHEQMIGNMVKFNTGYVQVQHTLYQDEPSLDNSLEYTDELQNTLSGFSTEIDYIVPRIESYALAAGDQGSRAVMVLGVDLEKEARLNDLLSKLTDGAAFAPAEDAVLLTQGLAEHLKLQPQDTVVLIGQGFYGVSAAGKYVVSGIIKHNLAELNNRVLYMDHQTAQQLFGMDNRYTQLLIMPKDPAESDKIAASLGDQLNDEEYRVMRWQELMPELLQAIEFDKVSNAFMLGLLYLVIGFGIFGTMLTMTLEREREFGMILSVGMQRYQLGAIVILESLFISILGILSGIIISLPILIYFYNNPIPLSGDMAKLIEEYGLEPVLPFSLDPQIFWNQATIVFFISIIVVIYPVFRVMRLNVLKASRS